MANVIHDMRPQWPMQRDAKADDDHKASLAIFPIFSLICVGSGLLVHEAENGQVL